MSKRDDVLLSLAHKQPDKTPYNVEFTQHAWQHFVQYAGEDVKTLINNSLTIGGLSKSNAWVQVRPDIWMDEFGVEWNRSIDPDIGNVCNELVTPSTLDDYVFPDADDPSRYEWYRNVCPSKVENDQFIVANLGFSLFERAWTMTGFEQFIADLLEEPEFAAALLDKILEYNLKVIHNVCQYDVDAVMFGDDWGTQTGLITGPRLWRNMIKPRIREMYQAVKSHGKFVFIHSCGKVMELFPDLIECGLNCFNPFQPEVIDVEEAKREYGSQLTFYGGISTQRTLPYGTVDQVRDETKRLVDVVGRDGGLIAAPAHAIPGDAKPENIIAMLDVLNNQ